MTKSATGTALRFSSPDVLLEAARRLRSLGYERIEGYSPFPLEELDEILMCKKPRLPAIAFVAGLSGAGLAYLLQYWTAVEQYPLNVGGRPLHSWPAFIPVTFELTVLFAAFAIVGGFLVLTGLPRLHHPVFGIATFERATDDRFFLVIDAHDPLFDSHQTRPLLASLGAEEVLDVPS